MRRSMHAELRRILPRQREGLEGCIERHRARSLELLQEGDRRGSRCRYRGRGSASRPAPLREPGGPEPPFRAAGSSPLSSTRNERPKKSHSPTRCWTGTPVRRRDQSRSKRASVASESGPPGAGPGDFDARGCAPAGCAHPRASPRIARVGLVPPRTRADP